MKQVICFIYKIIILTIVQLSGLYAAEFTTHDLRPSRKYNLVPSYNVTPSHHLAPPSQLVSTDSMSSLQWVLGQPVNEKAVIKEVDLPPQIDFSHRIYDIHDQGDLGSCTGQAITCAMEYSLSKKMNFDQDSFIHLSPLFVYYNERRLMGTTKRDSGSSLADGIRSIHTWGTCTLKKHDNEKDFRKRPRSIAYKEAENYKLLDCVANCRVQHDLKSIKNVLAQEIPVLLGIYIYTSFESEAVRKTGMIPIPESNELKLGGHAVLLVGYNDETQLFKGVNSYGKGWGENGFFYLPYGYVINEGATATRKYTYDRDIWTINIIGSVNSEGSESSESTVEEVLESLTVRHGKAKDVRGKIEEK